MDLGVTIINLFYLWKTYCSATSACLGQHLSTPENEAENAGI